MSIEACCGFPKTPRASVPGEALRPPSLAFAPLEVRAGGMSTEPSETLWAGAEGFRFGFPVRPCHSLPLHCHANPFGDGLRGRLPISLRPVTFRWLAVNGDVAPSRALPASFAAVAPLSGLRGIHVPYARQSLPGMAHAKHLTRADIEEAGPQSLCVRSDDSHNVPVLRRTMTVKVKF